MNTHNPMDRGISYPWWFLPRSVAPNMLRTNTNVSKSSIPNDCAPWRFSAGAVTPSPPLTVEGVRPYNSAAPKIPWKNGYSNRETQNKGKVKIHNFIFWFNSARFYLLIVATFSSNWFCRSHCKCLKTVLFIFRTNHIQSYGGYYSLRDRSPTPGVSQLSLTLREPNVGTLSFHSVEDRKDRKPGPTVCSVYPRSLESLTIWVLVRQGLCRTKVRLLPTEPPVVGDIRELKHARFWDGCRPRLKNARA